MSKIELGQITSAVGIKGEVRVYPYTDEPGRFRQIKELELDGKYVGIESVRYQKNMVILKLSSIPDRNAAEAARGKKLYLDRERLWEVPENTYFVEDLIGMRVIRRDGSFCGTLKEVVGNPAHDMYRIEREDGKSFLLPAVSQFIADVDTDGRVMTVDLIEGLEEL